MGVMRHRMKRIQSKLYKIRTYDICKISLSWFDDKRYILDDGINSLAYFQRLKKSMRYVTSKYIFNFILHIETKV